VIAAITEELRQARLALTVLLGTIAGLAARRARRPGDVRRQCLELGNRSVLFVSTTLGFIGMVLVFQTCLQVSRITGDLSQVGGEFVKILVHEFGPSLTAMMLATRVGAGIAAEVGSMTVTEQVDALRMSNVDPVRYLIVPRFLASILMTPVLAIYGVAVAFVIGTLTAWQSFGVNPRIFFDLSKVTGGDLLTFAVKSLAYGAAIPIMSGASGLGARGGSVGVGAATTRAVISSSFVVIVLDFLISSLAILTWQAGDF
jgi:phospholipid/cholesterol/gamma-HCH transport system permease protein